MSINWLGRQDPIRASQSNAQEAQLFSVFHRVYRIATNSPIITSAQLGAAATDSKNDTLFTRITAPTINENTTNIDESKNISGAFRKFPMLYRKFLILLERLRNAFLMANLIIEGERNQVKSSRNFIVGRDKIQKAGS